MRFAIGAATLALGLAVTTAGAATLYVGDTVTATGTGAGQTYTVTNEGNPSNATISPTSVFDLGNSFNETIGSVMSPATGADFNANATGSGGPWNFQDDYYFSLNPGAQVQAAVVSNSMSNVEDLQVRLIYAAGNIPVTPSNPVLGSPAGGTLLNALQTLNLSGGSINLTAPANVDAGNYILQIRGEAEGDQAASYGGSISFTPVPLPASLPLLLLSVLGLGLVLFRRRGACAALSA
jgi:hypothetical protein